MQKKEIIPGFKIMGNASDKSKAKAKKNIESKLTNHMVVLDNEHRQKLLLHQYNKTKEEEFFIELSNCYVNKFRVDLGLPVHHIPPENYHFLPGHIFKKEAGNARGIAYYKHQGILIDVDELRLSLIMMAGTIAHETFHLHGHLTVELGKDEKMTCFRLGVECQSPQKKGNIEGYHQHFLGLNEGITAEFEKRFINEILNISFIQEEKNILFSSRSQKLRQKIAKERKIFPEDILWLSNEGDKYLDISYHSQRQVLYFICQKIAEKLPTKFPHLDSAYQEFLRAHFTGHLLPLARIIEAIWGEGSFRRLGDMGVDRLSAMLTLEAFKRMKTKI